MEKLTKKVLKKEEGSDFALEQLEALEKMVFPVEFRLCQRFIADHDFHEGCRAILIDKDKNPKWQPSTLKEVSEAKVEYYFSKFDENKEELIV
uniref:3-hydroxyisobutyryl-CoA hydrolase n=1 Tax=Meloidogyne hapla TaxID=6305 RepID=A0A1I8BDV4_MELHA